MTVTTTPVVPVLRAASLLPSSAGRSRPTRLPVADVTDAEELLASGYLHARAEDADPDSSRTARRDALLHRLELDRQRQRRRRSA